MEMKCSTPRFALLSVFLCVRHAASVYSAGSPCIPRKFNYDSVVCVCNSTYCDTIEYDDESRGGPPPNPFTYYTAYVSSRDGLRFEYKSHAFEGSTTPTDYSYEVGNATFQTVMGFGGAFTDAATLTMSKLTPQTRMNIINSYFSDKGIEYNIGRIPMASCDFSQRIYSYDDTVEDTKLEHFGLQDEDLTYKIPAIKDAIKVSKRNISLFGSPWSAPAWMKTNNNMTGKGSIKGQPGGMYFKSWANYFVKFIQKYKEQGVDIWGLTAQNEPVDGLVTDFPFQCMGWTAEMQRDFIAQDLGPALEAAGLGHVKLMILDDQRIFLPYWADTVLTQPEAAKYVSGIAVHWYVDLLVPTAGLDATYERYGSRYFILNTEACEQDLVDKINSVQLGNWYRAERYYKDIMQDLKHGVSGWVDWNIALDMQGGPNWNNNWADSPIIVNAEEDEFYKQPMFYAMGHFSKFVPPGSKVLEFNTTAPGDDVDAVFFLKENNFVVGNFINSNPSKNITIRIHDPNDPGYIMFDLPAKSFATFIYPRS